ncbi:MAG: hypothetical protein ABSG61_09900 [Gemmatimonadales bacterium]
MRRNPMRGAVLPLRVLWSPGAALDEAPIHRVVASASLVLLVAALGALALPRLLRLLDVALQPTGRELLDAHLAVLRIGLGRLLLFERLVLPLPFLAAGTLLALAAAPVLSGRGVSAGAVVAVLALGAAPLLVQRAGELAVVLATPGAGLGPGDVAGLPARFNVGVAGALAAAGVAAPGWLGAAAEAANGVGLWVVALWGWGLARLDRDASRSVRGAHTIGWCVAATSAYAAGWALHVALYPTLLVLVMGAP